MVWRVELAGEAERDLDLIFDHHLESCQIFGEDPKEPFAQAEGRAREIRGAADRLGAAPRRGERNDDLLPGLRHVTMGRAVYWFEVDRVRAWQCSWGGRDHIRHMLVRLLV